MRAEMEGFQTIVRDVQTRAALSHQQAASLDYLAVVRRLARVQDDLRKAIARPLACDAHHGETEPLAYSRDRLAKMPA
jgi:hypothetical protein